MDVYRRWRVEWTGSATLIYANLIDHLSSIFGRFRDVNGNRWICALDYNYIADNGESYKWVVHMILKKPITVEQMKRTLNSTSSIPYKPHKVECYRKLNRDS